MGQFQKATVGRRNASVNAIVVILVLKETAYDQTWLAQAG
jgi:hypothetical protein